MAASNKQWDFFLAHAGVDAAAAEELFGLLSSQARVFLDSRCLLPGDDWDRELAKAQTASRVTVVLLSAQTEEAYYQREEIAAALDMARRDKTAHRVVPLYLDDPEDSASTVPYGLRLKHGLTATALGGLEEPARKLLELIDRLRGAAISPARAESSARALNKLTAGSTNERFEGLKEITRVFRPLVATLIAILVVGVLLMAGCLFTPGLDATIDRPLAVLVLASLCAAMLASLMIVFLRSVGLAREIVHSGATQ